MANTIIRSIYIALVYTYIKGLYICDLKVNDHLIKIMNDSYYVSNNKEGSPEDEMNFSFFIFYFYN